MTENTYDEFFTREHGRLTQIARIADLFVWIVVIINTLSVGARYLELQGAFMIQNSIYNQSGNFTGYLANNPVYTASLIVDLASIFLRGIFYGLVLKGVSLGLNMIVETDLNYWEKYQEANND